MGTNANYSQILILAVGIFCIYRGIMTFISGKLTEREEARLRDYSENGARKFRLLSAIMNIVGGVFVCVVTVIQMVNLVDRNVFRIVILAILAVMLAVYFLIRNSCKNEK